MLKNQKYKLSRKVLAAVAGTILLNSIAVQAKLPNTAACNSLTRLNIKNFRIKTNTAIALLEKANFEGNAVRINLGGSAGGALNSPQSLRDVAGQLNENTFLAPPCKSMFYPLLPEFGPSAGDSIPNNINACFRVHVSSHLEYAMYQSTLHAWYNKVGYTSRPSAEAAFNAVSSLLRESRKISNNASACLLQSTQDASDQNLVLP